MILYGRNLSPFARRVAIWLRSQDRAFEQRPLATFDPGDFETIRTVNPVGRVPALVLDDGAVLTECFAICDWLDETAPEVRLIPDAGLARRVCLGRIAVAAATTDKAVALFYERNRRPVELHWSDWIARLESQIAAGLGQIEAGLPKNGFSGGEGPDGADVATVCLHDFVALTNPGLLAPGYSRLAALAERANALAPFAETRPAA